MASTGLKTRHESLPLSQTSPQQKNETLADARPPEFPDGGLQAWTTVAGAWMMQISTFGYANSYGVYQGGIYFYVREYLSQTSPSNISWIGSTQLFIVLSIGLLTGRAFDRGYFYHLIITGTLLFTVCLFMLSLTQPHQYYQIFLCQGLGLGIAIGLTYIPTVGVIAHHFQRHRTLVLGIIVSGSSMGGVIHPIMLNRLLHSPIGFAVGVRASAGFNLALMAIATLLMRTRLPPRPSSSFVPAIKRFAKDPPYILAVCGGTLLTMGLFFPVFYLQLYSIQHGVNQTLAFYTISLLNGSSVLGRVIPNWAAHHIGVYTMVILASVICGAFTFVLLATHNAAGIIAFSVFFGFFSGAYFSLLAPMLVQLSDSVAEIGIRMGICFTFTGLGSFIGTPIAGALLTSRFVWWRPTLFAGVVTITGSLFLTLSNVLLVRKRQTANQSDRDPVS